MILDPAILALITVSIVVSGLMMLASAFALSVIRHWNIDSGSERQLRLERRTYLISTIIAFCFAAELASLLLFVYTAEQLSSLFVGAMCATGVLNINPWGWPTLFLKTAIFFVGAVWLMLNRIDNQAADYPLIRRKYRLLLFILPLLLAEAVTQTLFFTELDPNVITSCCGALFTPESEGVAAEVSSLEPRTAVMLLTLSATAMLVTGAAYLIKRRGEMLFASVGAIALPIALIGIVSCVALYIYEHPHHHCPFCILKGGHGFIGYLLYLPLFAGTALSLGVGAIAVNRKIPSLAGIIPREIHRHIVSALLSMTLFYVTAGTAILRSNLKMSGVWW